MAGSITETQWLQQYATRSQVEGVLGQRDRLLLERGKLQAVVDAARAVVGVRGCGWPIYVDLGALTATIDGLAAALDALDGKIGG